jgi:hypothetical protein
MFFHKRKALEIRSVYLINVKIVLVLTKFAYSTPTGNDCKVSELLDEKVTNHALHIACPVSHVAEIRRRFS